MKFKLSEKPVGSVLGLSLAYCRRTYSEFNGMSESFCRTEDLPPGACTVFARTATHIVRKGEVWAIESKNPEEFLSSGFTEEISGGAPDDCPLVGPPEPLHPAQEVYYRMQDLYNQVTNARWALCEVGCKRTYVVWGLTPTLIGCFTKTASTGFQVIANVCVYGGTATED